MSEYLHCALDFNVNFDKLDFCERLKISSILQYFQDLATVHAEQIGIGYQAMLSQNMVWVLNRVSAHIIDYPKAEDTVRAVTYPKKPNMVDAIRDYYIYSTDGKLLIAGTSKWCLLDATSHAIRRVAPMFKFPLDVYNPTLAIGKECPAIEQRDAVAVGEYAVRLTDLDRNLHVNNARYGDMILDACDYDWLRTHRISAFDINFMSELKHNNRYRIYRSEDQTYFAGKAESGADVFRATVRWENA